MRTCRYRYQGRDQYGTIEGQLVRPLSAAPWAGGLPDGKAIALADVQLLAPVEPSKVVCVGRNYRAHAKELGNEVPTTPLLFLKPPSSVIGPQEAIRCPEQSKEVHHEAELGVWRCSRRRRSVSRPSMPGRPMSSRIRSGGSRSAMARAPSPVSSVLTW